MSSLYIIRGPLRRSLLVKPCHVLKRCKFSARDSGNKTWLTPELLPKFPARTRFAPSPTGFLHIGSLRTALYNYLLAKATGGKFILRLEDTDQTRIVPGAEQRLYEDLKWAGLSWDEGPGVGGSYTPYRQSENLAMYSQYANQLLEAGRAYRCFCTPEELDQMRSFNIQEGNPSIYNGRCLHISPEVSAQRAADGHEYCIRFKRDLNRMAYGAVQDLVYKIPLSTPPDDDFILIKRDGYPTYHFANVIDDHRMYISHVIRGAEWLISTPKHIALYRAFGWEVPVFAHVGLLMDKQGQKLSKRKGDVDIDSWRDGGYLPIALLNYVLLLGWSTGKGVEGESQLMDMQEMISKFNLNFTKGNVIVNDKYLFFQKGHLQRLLARGLPEFCDAVVPSIEAQIREVEEQRNNPEISAQIGPIIRPARDDPSSGNLVSKSYIDRILAGDGENYKNARSYIQRIQYLIWEMPPSIYLESYTEHIIHLELHLIAEKDVPENIKAKSPELTKETRTRLFWLMKKMLDLLSAIKEEDWSKANMHRELKPFVNTVFSLEDITLTPDFEREVKIRLWGWQMLRWALSGMKSGPSVQLIMVLLGKEETLKRVKAALKVARRLDGRMSILRRGKSFRRLGKRTRKLPDKQTATVP
ncbi:hypothetical protein F5B19DRAFT_443958 [Rostrohypoxylon terebratum]|nr:hypothetical protein F5B19DRAFT_443958 [Rostrohypoxylon terebratum]